MTIFMVFSILCFLATVAMLWCFRGFSRALKQVPPTTGLLLRVLEVDDDSPGPNTSQVMELPRRQEGPVRAVAAVPAKVSQETANLVGLALLMGSRGHLGGR